MVRFRFRKLVSRHPNHPTRNLPLSSFVINLNRRDDRMKESISALQVIPSLDWQRFEAIERENGALGCALSHRELLRSALQQSSSYVMILEDDIEFLAPEGEILPVINEFFDCPYLDVLCIANNPQATPRAISQRLSIVCSTQTTSGYIVKHRALRKVLKSFDRSVSLLSKGERKKVGAIDQQWKRLQRGSLIFAVPRQQIARQRTSFSDIEKRVVDYST